MKKFLFIIVIINFQLTGFSQIVKTTEAAKPTNTKSKAAAKPPEKPKPIVIPSPEFINQPYYYDVSENKLIKLENTSAQLVTKKKTLGLKGSKQSLLMEDPSSKIRFVSKNSINFIIKTSGDEIDLTTYIKLYKFITNNEKREVNINSKEGMISAKEEQKGKSISFSVKLIARDNYMITFPQSLEAGEYGFVWVKNMELKECSVFAFGIDWRNSD